jgi:molybdopterin/thiamine biosynthesis adenylyltransferase
MRKINKYTISLHASSFIFSLFVDANNHIVEEINEDTDLIPIESMNSSGIVKCAKYSTHPYNTGDIISFYYVDGLNTNELMKDWEIEYINNTMFKLKNFSVTEELLFINGYTRRKYLSKIILHDNFRSQIKTPIVDNCSDYDFNTCNDIIKLFMAKYDIFNYNQKETLDYNTFYNDHIIPVISIAGALVSNEIAKLVSKKFIPYNQWLVWKDNDLYSIFKNSSIIENNIYLNALMELNISNIVLAGSNGLAVEHIKNLNFIIHADNFLNTPISVDTNYIVFDSSNVKNTNLAKNFILSDKDIGTKKTLALTSNIENIIPVYKNIKCFDYDINTDTIKSLDDYKNSIIVNALDNYEGRKIIDKYIYDNNIPFFNTGVDKLSINTQPIIPFITETFNNSNDLQYDNNYPECVIKNYPNTINHICQWSRENFKLFLEFPKEILNLNTKIISGNLSNNFTTTFYNNYLISGNNIPETTIIISVKFAVDIFIKQFYTDIKILNDTFSEFYLDSNEKLYWSGGKRYPKPIEFDISNETHLQFILTTITLVYQLLNINIDSFFFCLSNLKLLMSLCNKSKLFFEKRKLLIE